MNVRNHSFGRIRHLRAAAIVLGVALMACALYAGSEKPAAKTKATAVDQTLSKNSLSPSRSSLLSSMNDSCDTIVTPNYDTLQIERGPNPGLNVDSLWLRGGKGQGVRFTDVEAWWNLEHEDLRDTATGDPVLTYEPGQAPFSGWIAADHGTRSIGVAAAQDNGFGTSGFAPQADFWVYPLFDSLGHGAENLRITDAVSNAVFDSDPGDVILIEYCPTILLDGFLKEIPFEAANLEYFDIIKAASDSGIIVIQPAGNDGIDLDRSNLDYWRAWGYSGAIIVGAGSGDTLHRQPFHSDPVDTSTFGSRINVQGFTCFTTGTTGGGSDYSVCDELDRSYEFIESTSGASAQVAAAITALQSYAIQELSRPLTPAEMRQLISATGHPQGPDSAGIVLYPIGPSLNLEAAAKRIAGEYLCGDANADGIVSMSDATHIINYVYGGPPPVFPLESGDVNCSGTVNISDAVYIITYIWYSGPAPCNGC